MWQKNINFNVNKFLLALLASEGGSKLFSIEKSKSKPTKDFFNWFFFFDFMCFEVNNEFN
jgi:hypothetical protein